MRDNASHHESFLAHLAGPKGENQEILIDLIQEVLLDYLHWRRNYFPQDEPVISPEVKRQHEHETFLLRQNVSKMLAGLRRSFPFYSPRYIAHQQSETTLASIIGTVAGTLYNSNNVTPESGVVTVDWEIDACNELLRMVGYTVPPSPPKDPKDIPSYYKALENGFAWCHLTSGGTIANIEALWVARHVKYFPLAVQDVAQANSLEIEIKLPSGKTCDIRNVEKSNLVNLKPNESIYMLGKLVSAIRKSKSTTLDDANNWAMEMIEKSKYSPSRGVGPCFSEFEPAILASGAAHYSIAKAADILGIGRQAVEIIDADSNFRLDINCLRDRFEKHSRGGRCVLAVVAIAGTTEEGAIDPIHRVLEFRRELEHKERNFWLHVDAAWGGYLRCLFIDDSQDPDFKRHVPREMFHKRLEKISRKIGSLDTADAPSAFDEILKHYEKSVPDLDGGIQVPAGKEVYVREQVAKNLNNLYKESHFAGILRILRRLFETLDENSKTKVTSKDFAVDRKDLIDCVGDFVSTKLEITLGEYVKEMPIRWADYDVGMALCAMNKANSITIDPHKMGYSGYPCGAIAFRNDRVRHFITQQAPYITSSKEDTVVHRPPRHSKELPTEFDKGKIATIAFAPFTLEGSRPSSSACSLWLSSKTLPFNRSNHGMIVRSSLLATRSIYEWLVHWNTAVGVSDQDTEFEFAPYSNQVPDSNIIIFGIKKKNLRSLAKYNELTLKVYQHFSIQGELGDSQYSYDQPFFMSNTRFREPNYKYSTVKDFLQRYDFRKPKKEYCEHGLVVLRATVMNPYILPLQDNGIQNIAKEFMLELHSVAQAEAKKLT